MDRSIDDGNWDKEGVVRLSIGGIVGNMHGGSRCLRSGDGIGSRRDDEKVELVMMGGR